MKKLLTIIFVFVSFVCYSQKFTSLGIAYFYEHYEYQAANTFLLQIGFEKTQSTKVDEYNKNLYLYRPNIQDGVEIILTEYNPDNNSLFITYNVMLPTNKYYIQSLNNITKSDYQFLEQKQFDDKLFDVYFKKGNEYVFAIRNEMLNDNPLTPYVTEIKLIHIK